MVTVPVIASSELRRTGSLPALPATHQRASGAIQSPVRAPALAVARLCGVHALDWRYSTRFAARA